MQLERRVNVSDLSPCARVRRVKTTAQFLQFNSYRESAILFLLFLLAASLAIGQTDNVLHSFSGNPDGALPVAAPLFDSSGNLYGTTPSAGAFGNGSVFMRTPSGAESILYSFTGGTDGSTPHGGLISDGSSFYGTTSSGGAGSYGTVFKLTPSGELTTLYGFRGGADGGNPLCTLVLDTLGNLYGTTQQGGLGYGAVFVVTPSGVETTLHSFFPNGADGYAPYGGLVFDNGNLYGTTSTGGTAGHGTVYQITTSGTEAVIYSFAGGADGAGPTAPLIVGPNNVLYGTTTAGGSSNEGVVFSVTTSGAETILHTFTGSSSDGAYAWSPLIFDPEGNLFSTTFEGGQFGGGTIFEITPSAVESVIYNFNPDTGDGYFSYGGLTLYQGYFYGTTQRGGIHSDGTVFEFTFVEPLSITSPNATTFMESTPSTFTVTTAGIPTPSLTETGVLPSGITFTDNGNGAGTLSGTPASGTSGTYPITFTASNSAGSVSQSFTLTVELGVSITSGTSTTFTLGSPGSFTISTVGTPTPSITETGALPSGVTFVDNGNGSGSLSGTPAAGTTGAYPITFSASNGASSATQNFTLTVNEGPAITSGSATTFTTGTAGSFLVTSVGSPLPALTESGPLPSGITFVDNGNTTATLSGTPAPSSGGIYPITIIAANGVGTNSTQSFTLNVNQGLAITSGSMTTFTVGSTGWFSVTTVGFPIPAVTETGSLPGGVTFVDNGNGTATLSGTPDPDTGGTYPITITASNGGIDPDATQSFTLLVNQGAAIVTGNNTTFTVGTAGSFTMQSTGVPTAALTETGTLPSGVTFVDNGNGTATFSGTPAAGTGGSYPLTFSANNGVGSATMQSFTLLVNQGAAITSSNSTMFSEEVAGSFTVSASGDPIPALTETGILPAGVSFVDNGNGTATLSGTPEFGTAGLYGFTVQAANGVNPNATQSFTLTVNPAPATHLSLSAPASAYSGTAISFTLSALDSLNNAVPGYTGTVHFTSTDALATLPADYTFTAADAGTYTFTATLNTAGNQTISAMDAVASISGTSGTIQVSVIVVGGPVITSASATTFSVQALSSFLVTATSSTTPAFAETGALPTGVTFTDNGNGTAALAGTPAMGTAGTYPITITATNGAGSTTQAFTLTVDLSVAFTSGSSTTFTVGLTGNFTVSTVGSPTAALSETGSLPSGVTFVDNGDGTGALSGIPASGTAGTYPITFSAGNGASSATQMFTLTVNEGVAITSGSATTFATGAAGSFLVTTIGSPVPALTETGPLPTGITFVDNKDGTASLSGTPAAGSGGIYPITIAAANGVGTNATQSFTLTVSQGLAITSGSMTTFTVGSTGWFSVTSSGFPVPTLSETGDLPYGVTFVDNGNGTATLSGTPAPGTGGSYGITITANNGGVTANATQSFTLAVNQGAAIITGNGTTFTVAVGGTFTVSTTGVPVAALSETGALPSGVTFVDNGDGTGTLSGTPATGTAGNYAITLTANNGVDTPALQSFSLLVNQSPAITSTNTATFNEQAMGSFTVTTTGDPTPTLTETGNLPSGVSFIDNGDGTATIIGTPAAGTGGQYGFTIQASNGVTPNATQSFTLTVIGILSFTSGNAVTFNAGGAGSFTVATSGWPTPSLTEAGTLPARITFTDNGDGTATLAGTAPTTAAGTYPLTFTAHNGVSSDATQTFTLMIAANQITPVITWANPAPINQGEALGSTQLNAKANVAGTFAYSPAAGTVLSVGTHSLSVTFTPTNTAAYTTATATVQITVLGDTPYSIGGAVSGLDSKDALVLLDNGGNAVKVIGSGVSGVTVGFTFTQVLATGATYNVTVGTQPADEFCTVAHGSGTVSGKVTSVAVTCNAAATIGGKVSGLEPRQKLTLLDNGGDALTISGIGASISFTFKTALPIGATFDVTVGTQPLGEICTVLGGIGTVTTRTNITGIVVKCGGGNTIGGAVSGLDRGDPLVLLDNGGNALKVIGSGGTVGFTFTQVFATGTTYNVTVGTQPAHEFCTVARSSGIVGGNVTNIAFTCKAAATIGGTVYGLEPRQKLTLLDNGGDALTIPGIGASIPFTFKTALLIGATFDVTVGTQPLGEICTVLGGSGTVLSTTNITGIRVDCQ